jgi:alginate O-acetyltransferase complex protein AlgI
MPRIRGISAVTGEIAIKTASIDRRSERQSRASWREATIGWLPLLAIPAAVWEALPTDFPRWQRMWLFALAIYGGCKWRSWRPVSKGVATWRHAAYLLAWPGMDARGFLTEEIPVEKRPNWLAYLPPLAKIVVGLALIAIAAACVDRAPAYAIAWLGMCGIALVLHFGLFDALAVLWQRAGVAARPLMDWPPLAVSLSEYWGRRWNTAFRDLAHRFVFRPVLRMLGPTAALLAVFFVSGVVHELVITVPAGGGYGGPFLFFLIQAAGALCERTATARQLGLASGVRGWLFTMVVLITPLPLLFPPAFIAEIMLPMLRAGKEWL